MYFNPETLSPAANFTPDATLAAISAALKAHVKDTLVLSPVQSPPLSKLEHLRARDALSANSSSFFAFEQVKLGVADDGEAIVEAFVTGFATVIDAGMQRQLAALGLTCSIHYEVCGDLAEADSAIRMVEDTMDVTFEVFEA